MANKVTNWERLSSKDIGSLLQYYDFYENQQLERGTLGEAKSFTTYLILDTALTIAFFFGFYILYGFFAAAQVLIAGKTGINESTYYIMHFTFARFMISLFAAAAFFGIMYMVLKRIYAAQTAMQTTDDINQYPNDQHIALPEEIQRKFDWFPDVGATSDVIFSSMISHCALSNKGLNPVNFARRVPENICDEDGDVLLYKGEILKDADGNTLFDTVPMIDIAFMNALYSASGIPDDKRLRKFYDPTQIPYNPDNANREKLKGYDTVADLINGDWKLPEYEPQRPAGAYIVDTAPVNTMVLAITRAGKGQTVIEPTLDMWTRERNPNNMVINDPKGELLVKFYVRATMRGFQVVQFNLINAMKTDIYNPLSLAAEAAREGDFTKAALYVENIADVFFPVDGGEDPVWPNAANNAFKRAAYGLIDYYLEEERELRERAAVEGTDEAVLETKIDTMWGKVTLYNTYQLFVQLTSKKRRHPVNEFYEKYGKDPSASSIPQEDYEDKLSEADQIAVLWEGKPEIDLLTLYFNATDALPVNSMRRLVSNANNALKSMSGAEKMMSSVYGIAITAMSFFTDPTISTLTSGTPSQNADLQGMSFPRQFGVRFHPAFLEKYHLVGMQARWMSYNDKGFTEEMGKDFYHEDTVSREGWAKYYFKGKYPRDVAYVRLQIVNPQSGMLIRSFYFQFRKAYQTSLDARYYMTDPVLGEKIVKNGTLIELRPYKNKSGDRIYKKARTTFSQKKVVDVVSASRRSGYVEKEDVNTRAIIRTQVRYSEKPKMVFLVTPPHLMKYAKLILILVKQLVDLNFDKSYMTKSNQKPLLKTRFMLDELGNLQSEGHGISGFATMLSIGLGQEQQFTLILQTLQQLRDVYGDSVDKIVQGNTSNIVFLKSTDDSMLDTLQKMSGITHKSFRDSKTVTDDKERIFLRNQSTVTYTITTKEMPVISYNDMAFIPERNSIVFRAGDSPIWNRNEFILPMSWRLFSNTIVHAGHDYSLQTIPTLSSALDFDIRKNQPDFQNMLDKRILQAYFAKTAKDQYKKAYYTEPDGTPMEDADFQIGKLDPDVYSDEIMSIIDTYVAMRQGTYRRDDNDEDYGDDDYDFDETPSVRPLDTMPQTEENTEQLEMNNRAAEEAEAYAKKIYAKNTISRDDLVTRAGAATHAIDKELRTVYVNIKHAMERDTKHFMVMNGNLCGLDGEVYVLKPNNSATLDELNKAIHDKSLRVYSAEDLKAEDLTTYHFTDAFYRFLIREDSWDSIANGIFEAQMGKEMTLDVSMR